MSFSGRPAVPRPASTPPTSRGTLSARDSAPTKTTRQTKSKKPPPSQEAWKVAEKVVPDLSTAVEFLQSRILIPKGTHAISGEALVSGLLHFASAAPAEELARKGLIAFAYLARRVLEEDVQDAVCDAVVERAEAQISNRLDHHTSHVEDEVKALATSIETLQKEMGHCVEELRGACGRVAEAERALTAVREGLATQPAFPGEFPSAAPTLTLDAALARVRRAVTLAETLQRQVLVRGAMLAGEDGTHLSDEALKVHARGALDELARAGLSPPGEGAIESVKTLPQGDIVFNTSSVEMARWIQKPAVAKPFAHKMGMSARIVERTCKLVAERVPVLFDPQDAALLRAAEAGHGLKPGAIVRAEWIKPVEKRFPGQRTAFVMLTVAGWEEANKAIRGLTLAGRRVLVRRELEEPKRCSRCQAYGGHFARDCKAPHEVCANCAGEHPTSQCTVAGEPHRFRCANCAMDGHAAWDRACPTLRARVSTHVQRRADSGFRFFVTNAPETWVSEEDELARAPPPPTVWSQVRHRFEAADAAARPTQQSRLDAFYTQSSQSDAHAPRQ